MKGSRDKGESQFETGGAGIKQIQSEMGRGNQALKTNVFCDFSIAYWLAQLQLKMQ